MADTPARILDGYKVLDFSQVLAGPTVTRLMAEMGAEIIKVELPPGGDRSRGLPFLRDGRSGYFVQQNRGKKSLCIDLKQAAGRAVIRDMIPKIDVIVENFSPGTIGRLGFDYESVHALNPRIVMCSISLCGQTGPSSYKPGFDHIGASLAGVLDMTGEADGPPVLNTMGIGDISTGVHGLSAVLAALLWRERTGRGQWVDVSLVDTYFHYHDLSAQVLSLSGGAIKPRRSGRHHYMVTPGGIFKSREGYIFLVALDHQWADLCRTIGRMDLIKDSRFKANSERTKNAPELIKIIEDWLQALPSDAEALKRLDENRVPNAPVLSVEEAVKHPQLRARRTVRKIQDRILGEFEVPGFPLRFSEFPDELTLNAPFLGEHNSQVLSDYAGYSISQIKELEAAGILHQRDR
ncbi:MAG TPA: CoA transferase [Candidatus Binataceae bacterium]|nr:CoA transferase [Candidatus Binataceae bacterium]